jgi:hypothetical protein
LGGEATVEGIQLRCRRHNDYEGRLYFGTRRPARELVPEQVRSLARPLPRVERRLDGGKTWQVHWVVDFRRRHGRTVTK